MISDPKLPLVNGAPGLSDLRAPASSAYPPESSPTPGVPARPGSRLWFRRLGVLLFVFLCATIGVMLIILPWRSEWTENHLLLAYPVLRDVLGSGFVRGVCTGLGVLNIWIGFWEAIQYRE